jgi:hypothetical protein
MSVKYSIFPFTTYYGMEHEIEILNRITYLEKEFETWEPIIQELKTFLDRENRPGKMMIPEKENGKF